MLDIHTLHTLCQLSRSHCVGICAFLVPANMIITSQTLIFTGFRRPHWQLLTTAIASFTYAIILLLHVWTWFLIGVVMAPSFILLFLSIVCLGINFWAIGHPRSLAFLLHWLVQGGKNLINDFSYE
ncbi:MAG: hypothetical protein HC916_15770 [Coleofasciculaceae cyanobacterium SM2_1_6]|nr:hypothetical protein [Coleofasciculaceae cyanobacterium SM2_1_6]